MCAAPARWWSSCRISSGIITSAMRWSLCGSFCMGQCQLGVCVKVDDEFCSVTPEGTRAFFEEKVLKPLNKQ